MSRTSFRLGGLLLSGLLACGGGSNGSDPGVDPGTLQDLGNPDLGTDEGSDLESDEGRDLPVFDEGTTAEEDVPPEPGEFGYPCTDNAQCNSGFCVESPRGRVCTKTCVENCPADWTCKTISIGGEPISICTPLFLTLCDPCLQTKDCNSDFTGGTSLCIDRGTDGKFCGADCSGDGRCPQGYACEDVREPSGGTARQCVPENGGTCQCSGRAITLGLQTECFRANEHGICNGVRRCLINGLTDCDARTPASELCNGFDDDCNGLTDELQGRFPCTRQNEFGTCTGQGDCIQGAVANCDARVPTRETCNGMDDNCDGQTDEGLCYDGNPCTKDFCDPGSLLCVFEAFQGPCDDLNPCTVNDYCDATGICKGGSQKNCDDGNPCTDDFCDPGTGNCLHNNNTRPCEDGNPCTVNDYCSNGACVSGPLKDCTDDNICTINERCDPKTGTCTSTPNNGAPCDDGNRCTINDTCSGGECIGPGDWCDTQAVTCVPTPPKTFCLAPKCQIVFGVPFCPCICPF
ncbi:hypothetical protein KBD49_05950 [Myxococcota bacterium]|nr:hypothetical protein [Myxococcota bacterium]